MKKWIISRHTNNVSILYQYLKLIIKKDLTPKEKEEIVKFFIDSGVYRPRAGENVLSALEAKINQLCYFMFGYKVNQPEKRFILSPLGREYLNNFYDKEKRSKIFLAMLWGIQYPHPHSTTASDFSLYPFRLFFKLIKEERLGNTIYIDEMAAIVMLQKTITEEKYDALVKEILDFRGLPIEKKKEKFLALNENKNLFTNAFYEWDYFTMKILADNGIINVSKGNVIEEFIHGKNTRRILRENSYTLNTDIIKFLNSLEAEFNAFQGPLQKDEILESEWINAIYSFFPRILKGILSTEGKIAEVVDLLSITGDVVRYSKNNVEDKDSENLFEKRLEDAFNLFFDVEAVRISGPGEPDIECIYLPLKEKFLVEAKSTKNKLLLVNDGRLEQHRNNHSAKYTIVVTPLYVPAVLRDINGRDVVIISATVFADYLYRHIISNEREIAYEPIKKLIESSMGTDISPKVSKIVFNKFGAVFNK